MNEANLGHRANVVRITDVRKHPNADKLEIIPIPGTDYQYVGGLGQIKPGDLCVYIQPDSVVPERPEFAFIWEPNAYEGGVPEKKRRIKARKFRGEWSEGLLMPLKDVLPEKENLWIGPGGAPTIHEGDDVAELLGIYHYNPPEESTGGENEKGPAMRGVWPRSLRGWFYFVLRLVGIDVNGPTGGSNTGGPRRPEYDVQNYKNYVHAFEAGEEVVVTEKIHGSNARFTFDEISLFGGMKMFVGSRRLWKSPKSKCIWRRALEDQPLIEEWCSAHPGYTLYGEVVPTQKGYDYGTESGHARVFLFDILKPDRTWATYEECAELLPEDLQDNWVPQLYRGPFDINAIKRLVDGPSTIPGVKHKREGAVIRAVQERVVHHLGRLQLKLVSNAFLAEQA